MSVYEQVGVVCNNCAHEQVIEVAVSLDVAKQPWSRDSILERSFHRFACKSCGANIVADCEFLYTDYIDDQQCFYSVKRHKKGYQFDEAGKELNSGLEVRVPQGRQEDLYRPTKGMRRVVFGLDELREKLVAADADLKDTHVELVKLKILREHPVLLARPRLRLRLENVLPAGVEYMARFDHSGDGYRVLVPWKDFSAMSPEDAELEDWLAGLPERVNPATVSDDGYVNYERLSPHSAALARLQHYLDEIDASRVPNFFEAPTLKNTLKSLPTVDHLPTWAKIAIRRLIDFADEARLGGVVADLLSAAYNFTAEFEWGDNAIFNDSEDLFTLLDQLPDKHVQGNSRLDRIDISASGSWYGADADVISIDKDRIDTRKELKDYLYHEVGHSVHAFYDEQQENAVTQWINEEIGFLYLGDYDGWRPPNDFEIDKWINMMGGYGGLDDYDVTLCRETIKGILDPNLLDSDGNFIRTRPPLPDTVVAGHPFADATFGPRRAYDESTDKWWLNAQHWPRYEYDKEQWAFAFNYAYKHLMAIRVSSIEDYLKMLKYYDDDIYGAYAYYSPWEFFAEVYRVLYDPQTDPADIDDDLKTRLYGMLGQPEQTVLE